MRILKYLCLLAGLFTALATQAQYNPDNPPEPGGLVVTAGAAPARGGSVSPQSKVVQPGEEVTLTAYANSNYKFVEWVNAEGKHASTERSFRFRMGTKDTAFVAKFVYTPGNPGEPDVPKRYADVTARVVPGGGGSVSGTGRFAVGSKVSLTAYNNSNYTFVNWTHNGNMAGTNRTLSYTVLEEGNHLEAHFKYAPGNPGEPNVPAVMHKLFLDCSPAGSASFNFSSGTKVAENSTVKLTAYPATGYVFLNWTDEDGKVLSTDRTVSYTMPKHDTRLRANLKYSPDNPGEPATPKPGRNVIYGARELAMPGADFVYAVYLENADEIEGINIDLTMPEGVAFDMDKAVLTDRAPQHTLGMAAVGESTYRLTVRGTEPFDGANGPVVRIPAHLGANAEVDTTIPVDLAKGVVFKTDGSQTPVDAIDGSIKVIALPETLPDSPDFIVTGIAAEGGERMPGDNITLNWVVENAGNIAATGGWSESVFLVNEEGRRAMLGTVYYEGENLAPGAKAARTATLAVNTLPGISGKLNVGVSVNPHATSGEIEQKQYNNTSTGTGFPIVLGKRLVLELPATLTEGSDHAVRARIARSGSRNLSETFTLTTSAPDARLQFPKSVTIPRDRSAADFQVILADNEEADGDKVLTLSAAGADYDTAAATLSIVDNELPAIRLEADPDRLNEGETFRLTVTLPAPAQTDVAVALACDAPARLALPASLTVKAGAISASAEVTVVENTRIDGHADVTLRATAPRHADGEAYLAVLDNDIPSLELELQPAEVSESAGPAAIRGILRRTDNFDKRVTVHLSDNSGNELFYATDRIVLEPDVRTAEFAIGVTDNSTVDGDRDILVTAAVYISSCSCTASGTGAGVVAKSVKIIDNDGPSLTLSASKATILEGDASGITLTVTRNTDTARPLTVSISSNADEALAYSRQVTIPAGSTSATLQVTAPSNTQEGDNRTVVFTAQAEGFAKGTFLAMVTDSSLPDATIKQLVLSPAESKVGQSVEASVTVANMGTMPLPEITKTTFYAGNEAVGAAYTQQPLAAGESVTLKATLRLPEKVGTFQVVARANEDKSVKEIVYTNNASSPVQAKVLPPYTATVKVDKAVVKPAEAVKISGQLTGDAIANARVEVYVVNQGARQTIEAVSDATGRFEATYTPFSSQAGHFAVGACYPGEQRSTEDASFDIYGISYDKSRPVICRLLTGDAYSATLRLANPGVLPLSNVAVKVEHAPADVVASASCPTTIGGGEEVELSYTLTASEASTGNDWREVKLRVTSAEAGDLPITLYYYANDPKGTIRASIPAINTTVTQGKPGEYPFFLINAGRGHTGRISLSLPEWMTAATPVEMPSLAPGDSAMVVLRLATNDKMSLNLPVTGHIGVRCAEGEGISLPYHVVPVSEEKGHLEVKVCDEYTYYTAEAPQVAGAKVVLRNPSTGTIVHETATGETGTCTMEMPAGYYQIDVTAEKHEAYRNFVFVSAGRTEALTVDISYRPITISWDVEETEVEDEYKVNTIVKYETNVPMPVVKVTLPESIDGDNMAVGDATMINMNLTNIGLVRALNVRLIIPRDLTEWDFEPLDYTEPFELAPNQSVNVPIRITRIADESARQGASSTMNVAENMYNNFHNCMAVAGSSYESLCGKKMTEDKSVEKMAMKLCGTVATVGAIGEILEKAFGNGWGLPSVGGGGGGGGDGGYSYYGAVETKFSLCDPCDTERAEKIIDELLDKLPGFRHFNKVLNEAYDAKDVRTKEQTMDYIRQEVTKAAKDHIEDKLKEELYGPFKDAKDYADKIKDLTKPCEEEKGNPSGNAARLPARAGSGHSWLDVFDETGHAYADQLTAMDSLQAIAYGNRIWFSEIDEEKIAFLEWAYAQPEGVTPPEGDIAAHKPQSVSTAQAKAFFKYINGSGPNYPTDEMLEEQLEKYNAGNVYAKLHGFDSLEEQFKKAHSDCIARFEDMQENAVCASISLQISQTMTMTRQAFRGTLTVFNGHEQKPMKDVRLNLIVRDEDGNVATSHEFQMNGEKLEGFSGDIEPGSPWELGADATGRATVLFIPTKYAAPEKDKAYSFGGTLTYLDPFTDLVVTRNLYPVTLTVKPSPELDLTYFMQRDIFADDPLTPDAIEPKAPAEFALVIKNKGKGDAANVRMTTEQPKIIDNEKGLLIDFKFTGSQLNGQEKVMSLGGSIATDFGTIPAGTTSYAQWWLEASLLGHFVDYDVEATHVTSYGNPDLSLLDNVSIHELVHGFTADATASPATRAFLVNDMLDSEDLPDMIHFSNGDTEQTVEPLQGLTIASRSETVVELTATAGATDEAGWYYGSLPDPTQGRQKLVSVTRNSDGAEIPVDNVWQTACTLRDGQKPKHEARLHLVAKLTGNETYTLRFEPRPLLDLEVKAFNGMPEEELLHEPLKKVGVTFNKPVDPATFTPDDITLTCGGKHVDVSKAAVTALGDADFQIAFNGETLADGYYVLTVATEGVTDTEGFCGRNGKSVAWTQYADGKVSIKVNVSPAGAGTVSPVSGRFDYGTSMTFAAKPAEGYDFAGWTRNGKHHTDAPEFDFVPLGNEEFTANFTIRRYKVELVCDPERGHVENAASGIYDHGTVLEMKACPNEGYAFSHWTINGIELPGEPVRSVTVDEHMTIRADFAETTTISHATAGGKGFSVQPAPLRRTMTVTGDFQSIRTLSVLDIRGTKCLQWNRPEKGTALDVGTLQPGFYIVHAVTDNGTFVKKVLKR